VRQLITTIGRDGPDMILDPNELRILLVSTDYQQVKSQTIYQADFPATIRMGYHPLLDWKGHKKSKKTIERGSATVFDQMARTASRRNNTWEDQSNILQGAVKACHDYHRKHPDAPQMPTIRILGR